MELVLCQHPRCVDVLLNALEALYREKLYEYNRIASRYGYVLKPVHIVTKRSTRGRYVYVYYGRYWYRLERRGKALRWIYVGTTKPINTLPDPPLNPMTIIRVEKRRDKSCIFVEVPHLEAMIRYLMELVRLDYLRSKVELNSSSTAYREV